MRVYLKIIFILSSITLILCGCYNNKKEESSNHYYIKMFYKANDNAYVKQKESINKIKIELLSNFNIVLDIMNIDNANNDDAVVNKVLHFKDNNNMFVVYDSDNKSKLLGVTYGSFNNVYELMQQINKSITSQKDIYGVKGNKYLYIHNSNDIEYPNFTRFSSLPNFKETIFNNNESLYPIADNYFIHSNDDNFLIFDDNNNLLLLYNLENTSYYTSSENNSINLDATIIAHILNISAKNSKNKILYFYNNNNEEQMTELNKYKKSSKISYDIIKIPLINNDIRTSAMLVYLKEIFGIKDNNSTIVIINDFQDFNKLIKFESFKKSDDLLNYFRMKQLN